MQTLSRIIPPATLALLILCTAACDRLPEQLSRSQSSSPSRTLSEIAAEPQQDIQRLERQAEGTSSEAVGALFALTQIHRMRGEDEKSRAHLRRLTRLATAGNEPARVKLATILTMNGQHEEALPFIRNAAQEGNAQAAHFLSMIYSGEIGNRADLKNMSQAVHWREVAAQLGNADARREMAYYRAHNGE